MKPLTLLAFAITITACSGGGSGGDSPSQQVPNPGPTSHVTPVTMKSGHGFECIEFNETASQVWCRRTGTPSANLGIVSANFVLFVQDAASPLTAFEVWDNTVCIEASVTQRPLSRTSGQATYCIGVSSLGPNYASYPIVYSGPSYSASANGTPELTFLTQPFVGGDFGIGVMTNSGGTYLVMSDSSNEVTSQSLSCSSDGTTLTCPNFSVAY